MADLGGKYASTDGAYPGLIWLNLRQKRTRSSWIHPIGNRRSGDGRGRHAAGFLVGLTAVLILNGAVPFFASPTLGQMVWLSGFAQSFANESAFTIYARNFGLPGPASLPFGLSVAYPMALLLRCGIHAADAYSLVAAFWLSVAFLGAWRMSLLMMPGSTSVASICAVLWLSTPIVWAHSGYSALSLGIALLPFYFWALFRLFAFRQANAFPLWPGLLYVAACIAAVFMDGYTFVMLAVGGFLFGAYLVLRSPKHRTAGLLYALPLHFIGLGLAYLLYSFYIGGSRFDPSPMDFFRGWGVDLSFLILPSQGMYWLWDTLGLSVPRSDIEWFGDSSVWKTTFAAPIIAAGFAAWLGLRKRSTYATGFLLVAIFGSYMALGPSVKFFSKKPPFTEADPAVRMMPAEMALAPTGNAWLSENLPGFMNMRATYRWLALGLLGFWLLIVLGIGRLKFFQANESRAVIFVCFLTLSNLPHPVESWRIYANNRAAFDGIDAELVSDFEEVLQQGERVAFLPYRNDFLVNYIAARLDIQTYNIGGDKNLQEARRHWPAAIRKFQMGRVDGEFVDRVFIVLARREADAVVLPYIDMLWAAHFWPADAIFKDEMEPVLAELAATQFVTAEERQHYAIVRISTEFATELRSGELGHLVANSRCLPPRCLEVGAPKLAEMPREVGRMEEGQLQSDGRLGFLLFGPYAPMDAGKYRLVIFGTSEQTRSARADVVSELGRVEHAGFALSEMRGTPDGVLVSGQVTLNDSVNDLEVRVYVAEEDEVQVTGYRFGPED